MYTEHETVYRETESDWRSETTIRESIYSAESVSVVDSATGEIKEGLVETKETTVINFEIYKAADNDLGLVSGWANVAKNADGSIPLDWQGDIIAPETLEKAAIEFMLDYRDSGELHQGDSVGTVVESIVFTKAKQEAMGIPEGIVPEGWFITVKINDREVFEKVKNGEYKMFSIQGTGERVAV